MKSIGCSPADIIFGKAINLDRGILLEKEQQIDQPLSDWVLKRNEEQESVMEHARQLQQSHHEAHIGNSPVEVTEFEPGSFVLVAWPVTRFNPQGRPSKWDTMYRGPYEVLSYNEKGEYKLRNLVTGKEEAPKTVHLLKPFHYDEMRTTPREVALKDHKDVYIIDRIDGHRGSFTRKSEVAFKVKWLGYEESTWEPWKNVRDNSVTHEYLVTQSLGKHIPKKFL